MTTPGVAPIGARVVRNVRPPIIELSCCPTRRRFAPTVYVPAPVIRPARECGAHSIATPRRGPALGARHCCVFGTCPDCAPVPAYVPAGCRDAICRTRRSYRRGCSRPRSSPDHGAPLVAFVTRPVGYHVTIRGINCTGVPSGDCEGRGRRYGRPTTNVCDTVERFALWYSVGITNPYCRLRRMTPTSPSICTLSRTARSSPHFFEDSWLGRGRMTAHPSLSPAALDRSDKSGSLQLALSIPSSQKSLPHRPRSHTGNAAVLVCLALPDVPAAQDPR